MEVNGEMKVVLMLVYKARIVLELKKRPPKEEIFQKIQTSNAKDCIQN